MSDHENPYTVTASANNKFPPYALSLAAAIVMVCLLLFMGRNLWCSLGDYAIFICEAWNSSHTSQHLFDPYSLTHILHGVALFWLTGLLFKNLSIHWRFLIATIGEAAWEILENSNIIIEKYRANTASLEYFGDSVANSAGDLIACSLGFLIAAKLGRWPSLSFFLLVEMILLIWIKDGLLLNIVMLIYPLEAIKEWQMI